MSPLIPTVIPAAGTRRRLRPSIRSRSAFLAAVAAALSIVAAAPTDVALAGNGDSGGEGYVFDVVLAPYCIDGDFPLRVQTDAGFTDGTLHLTTAANGKLSGTLDISGDTLPVKGKVKFHRDGHSVKLTVKRGKKHSLSLKGGIAGNTFEGAAKDKGGIVPGATGFSMDISSAGPLVAQISAIVSKKKAGRLSGSGTVQVCGAPMNIKVSGREKKSLSLVLKGKGFRFAGKGDHVPGNAALSWSAKGFGANVSQQLVNIDTILAPRDLTYVDASPLYETEDPIDPNIASTTGHAVDSFSIVPGLPSGLSFDVATGAITGMPDTVSPADEYTVTATNFAGSTEITLDLEVRRNRHYSLATQNRLDAAEIRHFLNRTH